MYRSISYKGVLQKNFQEELHWYQEEFEIMFKNKHEGYTKQEIEIGNQIINHVTEIINIYHHEDFLHQLVEILNNLECKYPSFFLKLILFTIISSILVKIKLFIIAFIIFKIGIDSLVLNRSSLKK